MPKIRRKYTQGRFELASIIFALYEHWVEHKYKGNIFGNSVHGYKGLALFYKESIDVLNSYGFCVERCGRDVYLVSTNVVLSKQALNNGRCDLRRNHGSV